MNVNDSLLPSVIDINQNFYNLLVDQIQTISMRIKNIESNIIQRLLIFPELLYAYDNNRFLFLDSIVGNTTNFLAINVFDRIKLKTIIVKIFNKFVDKIVRNYISSINEINRMPYIDYFSSYDVKVTFSISNFQINYNNPKSFPFIELVIDKIIVEFNDVFLKKIYRYAFDITVKLSCNDGKILKGLLIRDYVDFIPIEIYRK